MEDFYNGMEENCQYGIWQKRLPFHSIPCSAGHQHFGRDNHRADRLLTNQ